MDEDVICLVIGVETRAEKVFFVHRRANPAQTVGLRAKLPSVEGTRIDARSTTNTPKIGKIHSLFTRSPV